MATIIQESETIKNIGLLIDLYSTMEQYRDSVDINKLAPTVCERVGISVETIDAGNSSTIFSKIKAGFKYIINKLMEFVRKAFRWLQEVFFKITDKRRYNYCKEIIDKVIRSNNKNLNTIIPNDFKFIDLQLVVEYFEMLRKYINLIDRLKLNWNTLESLNSEKLQETASEIANEINSHADLINKIESQLNATSADPQLKIYWNQISTWKYFQKILLFCYRDDGFQKALTDLNKIINNFNIEFDNLIKNTIPENKRNKPLSDYMKELQQKINVLQQLANLFGKTSTVKVKIIATIYTNCSKIEPMI